MKFLAAGEKINLSGEVADWHDLGLTRWNQVFRSALGEAVREAGAKVRDGVSEGGGSARSGLAWVHFKIVEPMERSDRTACKQALEIIASAIANNSAGEGACGGLHWRLEPAPIAKKGKAA